MRIFLILLIISIFPVAGYTVPIPKNKPVISKAKEKSISKKFHILSSTLEKNAKKEKRQKLNLVKKRPIHLEIGKFTKKQFSGNSFIELSEEKTTTKQKLENAYKALFLGHTKVAIKRYKDILKKSPNNKLAMFGLATSYHYDKQKKQAMKLYEEILRKYPDYTDAFNNFVLLLSEEYPKKAILELKKLEKTHPNFAPILAQLGVINYKIGNYQQATKYLTKALRIEPNNVVYRYNLAVLLDNLGDTFSARKLYRQVLYVSERGEKIPVSEKELFDRIKLLN